MSDLAQRLEAAQAEVARLQREMKQATCAELGRHDWQHLGGAWCGCDDGSCSVPVYLCSRCGDSDYGHNEEAADIRRRCLDE